MSQLQSSPVVARFTNAPALFKFPYWTAPGALWLEPLCLYACGIDPMATVVDPPCLEWRLSHEALLLARRLLAVAAHRVARSRHHRSIYEQVDNREKKTKSGADYWSINPKG